MFERMDRVEGVGLCDTGMTVVGANSTESQQDQPNDYLVTDYTTNRVTVNSRWLSCLVDGLARIDPVPNGLAAISTRLPGLIHITSWSNSCSLICMG